MVANGSYGEIGVLAQAEALPGLRCHPLVFDKVKAGDSKLRQGIDYPDQMLVIDENLDHGVHGVSPSISIMKP
jgi:hypothetical protein